MMSSSSAGSPSSLFLKASPNLFGGYGYGSRIRLFYRKEDAQFSIRISRKWDIRSSHRMNISPRALSAGGCGGGGGIRTMSVLSDESIVSLPPITSPWLMLPPSFVEEGGCVGGDMVYNFYNLADNEVVSVAAAGGDGGGGLELGLPLPYENAEFVGCSHGWIALFDNRNSDLFLFNPISGRHIKLPPINNYGCVTNVIISCSPDEDEKDCRAMMSYGVEDRLAFCWPGRSLDWTPIGKYSDDSTTSIIRSYKSFVYSSKQKLFFSITSDDEFDAWDLRDHRYPRRISMDNVAVDYGKTFLSSMDNNEAEIGYLRFLVTSEYSDELFLVRRFVMERVGPDSDDDDDDVPYKTIGFDVHKYYPKDRAFKYMDKGSLDGLAFFIGINHGFALCVDDYIGLKPDCIYFTDTYSPPDKCGKTYGGHDLGVFSYEDGSISPCYYPCDIGSIQRISPSPMWFTPNIPP